MRLDERRPLDWGQVAADAGYADQAHLIRDFHQFTGATPTQFQAWTLPSPGDGKQGDDPGRILDGEGGVTHMHYRVQR